MRRIAVIAGGWSSEQHISRISGRHMAEAARTKGYDTIEIEAGPDLAAQILDARPDLVLNALHGAFGEDGRVQGLLDIMGLPYTHSGVLASALGMNKARSRDVFAAAGLDIAKGGVFSAQDVQAQHVMPVPYVVKPVADGSSFGVQIIGENDPPPRLKDWTHGQQVLVEEFIDGQELTVGVLEKQAIAVTEIQFLRKYYDTSAKYDKGESVHQTPANIPDSVRARAKTAACLAHQVLGCSGVTRADFRYNLDTGRLVILEINTHPGMTPTSLVPEQARLTGMSYEDLVEWIILQAFRQT